MAYGLYTIVVFAFLISSAAILHMSMNFPKSWMVGAIIVSQMGIMFGVCMATSNALALALVNYKWCIGTASSLFGFFLLCDYFFFHIWNELATQWNAVAHAFLFSWVGFVYGGFNLLLAFGKKALKISCANKSFLKKPIRAAYNAL